MALEAQESDMTLWEMNGGDWYREHAQQAGDAERLIAAPAAADY
jgi:hypothetical protein